MQIVTFPPQLIDAYLREARELLESGRVAEGRYFREQGEPFVKNRHSVPVSSGGAALFCLLAFQRETAGRSLAIVQSNTMRALFTVPRLLGMKPLVVDSSYDDFMAMSPTALERQLGERGVAKAAVVVYSVIGGYLAPSFQRIYEICRNAGVPLVVDGAHAHYLDALVQVDVDVAYSFYATKVLPAGEGGLIVSPDAERMAWLRRFLMYDRFSNQLEVGINLRAGELGGALMHRLMTDATLVSHFKTERVRIAERYRAICVERGIRYLDPRAAADYNGYKLIVLDKREQVAALGTPLTEHAPTSAVFDTDVLGQPTALPHWCPPTYSSLGAARP
jgi:dTDP-4-amino-4,6-dideoxygalactose transaminase